MKDDFLSRWSRRKLAVREGRAVEKAPQAAPVVPSHGVGPAQEVTSSPDEAQSPAPLPPVESLTPESDFTPFMQAEVDPSVKRAALKTLFSDPRFNVMDGLDVYIDDYSKPDPLPPEWLAQMNQMKHLGHYIEKAVEGAEKGVGDAAPPAEAMPEEPAAFPETAQPIDTSASDPAAAESLNSKHDRV